MLDSYTLVWAPDKTPCREPILRAAARLERMGCRAIAAECGYFAYFQKDVARHVSIPVFSWGTLLDYAYSIVVHRDYYGHV